MIKFDAMDKKIIEAFCLVASESDTIAEVTMSRIAVKGCL
jgi:hypothetical protein